MSLSESTSRRSALAGSVLAGIVGALLVLALLVLMTEGWILAVGMLLAPGVIALGIIAGVVHGLWVTRRARYGWPGLDADHDQGVEEAVSSRSWVSLPARWQLVTGLLMNLGLLGVSLLIYSWVRGPVVRSDVMGPTAYRYQFVSTLVVFGGYVVLSWLMGLRAIFSSHWKPLGYCLVIVGTLLGLFRILVVVAEL